MVTPYPELDAVLADLVGSARDILGDTFVGAYVQGSFALGAGDLHSDCDFIIATTVRPAGRIETALRRLHDEIPTRDGYWPQNLEGSYADVGSLRTLAGSGTPWLFNDHGHRELTWDTHCNNPHARWILRHHGIRLAGPPVEDVVDEVPPEALRAEARAALPEVLSGVRQWAPFDIAWTQRYLVSTYCRVLYTLHTGEVTSKTRSPGMGPRHPRPAVAAAAGPGAAGPLAGLGSVPATAAGRPGGDVRVRRPRGVLRPLTRGSVRPRPAGAPHGVRTPLTGPGDAVPVRPPPRCREEESDRSDRLLGYRAAAMSSSSRCTAASASAAQART